MSKGLRDMNSPAEDSLVNITGQNGESSPQKSLQSTQASWFGPSLHGLALASVLGALMLTLLLEALDQTIVGTALPRIVAQFQGFDRYVWVGTAYLLASITMIPIIGKLSDQFGRKWFFISGVTVFLLGSFLSGTAQDMNQLIAFRAIQGLGAGMGIALVFTGVGELLPPAERSRWQGIFSGVYGFSSVVGPTLGGWLTDHGPLLGNLITDSTRWRWIFYVNLPFGVLALIALFLYYPRKGVNTSSTSEYHGMAAIRRIDFAGALLVAAATICLLIGLTWGSNQIYDWNSIQIISILIASAVLYVLFIIRELFAAEPILPLTLFKKRVFAADALLALMIGMVLLSLVYYLPLFLQGVLGSSASDSGLVLTPLTISIVVGATTGGILVGRLGRYKAVGIGAAVILSVGIFLLSRLDTSTSLFTAGIYMVITGVGLGIFMPMMILVGQNAQPRRLIGVSTSVITYLRALGQTLGLAIVGTVVTRVINTELPSRLPVAARQLPVQTLKYATDTQVLVNPAYRDSVVKTATQHASTVAQQQATATAQVPPGPQHDQIVATIGQQAANHATQTTHTLLSQVFESLRQALTIAITHGFLTVLVFCAIVFVAVLCLKDIPLARRAQEKPAKTEGESVLGEEQIVAESV
jgi:EmrB/QacA subfamily drug resistance transporter